MIINVEHKHISVTNYRCMGKYTIHASPWSTKAVLSRWGIFVAIAKNTLHGSKLYIFFYAKNH